MSLFTKNTWKDRVSEYPNRRTLTKSDNTTEVVSVTRNEGTVTEEGSSFNATMMNGLETRVESAFDSLGDQIVITVDNGNCTITRKV